MSLTSYRAAPPRDSVMRASLWQVSGTYCLRPVRVCPVCGSMLEDLAATDFPVP